MSKRVNIIKELKELLIFWLPIIISIVTIVWIVKIWHKTDVEFELIVVLSFIYMALKQKD